MFLILISSRAQHRDRTLFDILGPRVDLKQLVTVKKAAPGIASPLATPALGAAVLPAGESRFGQFCPDALRTAVMECLLQQPSSYVVSCFCLCLVRSSSYVVAAWLFS